MTLLDQVTTGRSTKPRRIMVYGTHGIGKSTFAASAEVPIFIQTEEGLEDIGAARFPLAGDYAEVVGAISELCTADHEYKTVVIDSLDWLEQLIWQATCKKHSKKSIEDFGYGKGYVFALDFWREVLDGLGWLRQNKRMTVILVAHAEVVKFDDPSAEPYDRYAPRLHKRASALVQEWCDEVLFANYRVFTKSTDEGFGRKRTKGVGDGERVLKTSERPSHIAKNRLGLPDEIPLDYSRFAELAQTQTKETDNG